MIAGQGIAEVDEFSYLGATFVLFVKREVVWRPEKRTLKSEEYICQIKEDLKVKKHLKKSKTEAEKNTSSASTSPAVQVWNMESKQGERQSSGCVS